MSERNPLSNFMLRNYFSIEANRVGIIGKGKCFSYGYLECHTSVLQEFTAVF